MTSDITDPEDELAKFHWQKLFNGDGDQVGTQLNKLWSVVSRLPDGRGGSPKYWLNQIFERMPPMLHLIYMGINSGGLEQGLGLSNPTVSWHSSESPRVSSRGDAPQE